MDRQRGRTLDSQVEGVMARQKPTYKQLEKRFWKYVDRTGGGSSCWIWTKGRNSTKTDDSYGRFNFNGRTQYSHRVAYQLYNGVSIVSPKTLVCHNCPGGDKRACCNPAHLFLGRHLENVKDAIKKGTHVNPPLLFGRSNPTCTFSDSKVQEMRRMYDEEGYTCKQLATIFDKDRSAVWSMVTRRTRGTA